MSEEQTTEATPLETAAPETTPAPEMVPKAEFEKVMAQLHKYKAEARELSAKSVAERERLLAEQGRWEELAKEKDARLKELEEYNKRTKEAFVSEKKFNAVKEAALKSGIRPEALMDLELVALDKVQVETTSTGRVNVLGVEAAIENLKLSRPHWFGAPRTQVAGSTPNVSAQGGLVTAADLVKLSNEARKSGDYTAYEKATRQYKQQK